MNNLKTRSANRHIAIVATDDKRAELIEWSYFNKEILSQHELTATGETGIVLEGTMNRTINKLFTAETGGYQQLASLIENGRIDMLFFFAEPAATVESDLDLKNLLVVAAKHNIVVASNKIMTGIVMASEFPAGEYRAAQKKHTSFLNPFILFVNQLSIKPFLSAMQFK